MNHKTMLECWQHCDPNYDGVIFFGDIVALRQNMGTKVKPIEFLYAIHFAVPI